MPRRVVVWALGGGIALLIACLAAPARAAETPAPSATSAAPGPAPAPAEPPPSPAPRPDADWRKPTRGPAMLRMMSRATALDLNLEGAYGRVFADRARPNAFLRGRVGVTFVRDPLFQSLGVTYEVSGLSPATFGLQGELSWIETGLWAQAGALLDVSGRGGAMASLGWAIFGVESELRGAEDTGRAWAIYGKIRLPIGIFIRAIASR